jgi:para-nitrobenzyl esterase
MLFLPQAAGAAAPRVMTQAGMVEGATEKGVDHFLGVPFAAPPVGPLRWRAPQPVAGWAGVRPATSFGPDCMQWPLDYSPGPGYVRTTSEDCLTVNIWRPAGNASIRLPVMVWIHGGAFMMGAGSWPVYQGANLARQGVMLVTLNYRLGRFGFFAHPALTAEDAGGMLGNYGLLDQIAALKWVKANIPAFGGDPTKVTVFGESAGAFSTNALLASPLARGLFARAISQSGGGEKGLGALPDMRLPETEAIGLMWTRSIGIADTDLAAMRALPAKEVLGPQNPRVGGQIIIDGRIVPEPVDQAFLQGRVAHVPYVVGANSWEYSLLQWLPGAADAAVAGMGAQKAPLMALYEEGGKVGTQDAAERLWGDAFMVAPARFLARQMAATGAPTWLYRYSYVPRASRGVLPGAAHSAEISLIFRNEIDSPYFKEGAADTPMADTISGYWVRFAKTGDPNGGRAPGWPAYAIASDALLDFTNAGPKIRVKADKTKFDLIDKAYLARARLVR